MTRLLEGKIALVTGASRGIGYAVARRLAREGAHILAVARTAGALEELDDAIQAEGGSATLAPLDLKDFDGIDRMGGAVAERWGRLDILVLNAGQLGPLSPLSHVPPKDWEKVIGVNLTASYRLIRAFDLLLRQSDRARVIGLSSSVATDHRAYWGPYAASKAGLEALLDCYAEEVANISSIRVAVVNPGATRTAMRKSAFPSEDPESLKGPEAVAGALLDLLVADFETRHRLSLPRTL